MPMAWGAADKHRCRVLAVLPATPKQTRPKTAHAAVS
jgi:hypothetical protein